MKTHIKKSGNYFPSQPEIKTNTSYYKELKPVGTCFCNDIALFYQFKTDPTSPTVTSLIPDGCFDFLFCCHPTRPTAFLWTSPFHRKTQPQFEKDCEYFGVRFFPEQSMIKIHYSMNELLDQQIPLLDVMSVDQSLVELISSCHSFNERIVQFENYLQTIRIDLGKNQKIVKYAIHHIYSSRGMLNVNELSDAIGYSEQHIRKKFEAYIGFSPKQFCQIVKFQNSLDMYLEEDDSDILNIIYENGYYDQAHFIKGFKKFIHLTPRQYKQYFDKTQII